MTSAEQSAFEAYRSAVETSGQRISFATAARQLSAYAAWRRLYDPESAKAAVEAARKALARRLAAQ